MGQTFTVDIDIGGTLTDGLFSNGEQQLAVKVDTTPHDFTVCFFDCLQEGANRLGYDQLSIFLADVGVIRWSSTIATNVLAEGKGPKLGLLISEGFHEDLYGQGVSPAIPTVLAVENIEQISNPFDEEEVLRKIRLLLEQGVRRICVSLKHAFDDPAAESAIKKVVQEHFPDHYLGAVPVLLGSDILHHPDDQTRTHMGLLNAYVHTPLAVSLFRAEDELLLEHSYRKPLYIGHVNGGVARVAKTKGIDTMESGPVFGLKAAAYFAKLYNLDQVISLDVGGTTAKIGLILNGEVVTVPNGDFFGIPLKTPWILLRSIALGGGSIARVNMNELKLGPDSMGAFPGPACYDLGGEQATLTDAFLVIGAMNPNRFLGGRRELNIEKAREVIEKHISSPLNISVEEGARRIVEKAIEMVAEAFHTLIADYNLNTEHLELFAFGGNGANFATGVADQLGLSKAYIFGLGSVLSAFGSSVSDICHIHEEWPYMSINAQSLLDLQSLIKKGRERVVQDLEGEGFSADSAEMTVELVLKSNQKESQLITLAIEEALGEGLLQMFKQGEEALLEKITIKGIYPVARLALPTINIKQHQAEQFGKRSMLWPEAVEEAPIFSWDQLQPGAYFQGPACLEGETLSCLVLPHWKVMLDGLGNAIMSKGGE